MLALSGQLICKWKTCSCIRFWLNVLQYNFLSSKNPKFIPWVNLRKFSPNIMIVMQFKYHEIVTGGAMHLGDVPEVGPEAVLWTTACQVLELPRMKWTLLVQISLVAMKMKKRHGGNYSISKLWPHPWTRRGRRGECLLWTFQTTMICNNTLWWLHAVKWYALKSFCHNGTEPGTFSAV